MAVITGTHENIFARSLEKELRHLGVETTGAPQGEIISEGQVSGMDALVFVVDEGFAAAWRALSSGNVDRIRFGTVKERIWISDLEHHDLADNLRMQFDPASPAVFALDSYDRNTAAVVAQQIVDRFEPFSAKEQQPKPASATQNKISQESGSARTRTAEEKERDQQSHEKRRFESGTATLGNFFSSARFGRIITESDVKALRCGSAIAATRLSPTDSIIAASKLGKDSSKLTSLSILLGYLLSASFSDESPGSALGRMAWHLLLAGPNRKGLSDRIDFWRAVGLEQSRAEIEERAASDSMLNCRVSSRLGKLLSNSATLIEASYEIFTFNSTYFLACIIGVPGEETDDSAIHMLESLGASPRDLRPMFRDWLAMRHPASPMLFDRVLGVTAEEAKGSYTRDPLPTKGDNDPVKMDRDKRIQELRRDIEELQKEWAFPTDFHGKPLREDLQNEPRAAIQKTIDAARAELAQLEARSVESVPAKKELIGHGWHDGVAGIATGMVQFEDDRDVEDALEIEAYATRFARVIALRNTELPLSVGLFGEWGSGKTYFMKLLRQEIRRLGEKNDSNWCSRVVPIRFNAWHYLDTNLWASLVTEMFDQLFDYLAGPAQDAEKRLEAAEKVMKEIENGKGAVSEVKEEVNLLEKEKQWAEKEIQKEEKALRIAERNTNRAQKVIAARMDDLKALLPGVLENSEWNTALKAFGLDKAIASWNQLEGRLKELRSLNGRVRALGSTMSSGRWGLVSLLVLLAILALVPIALGKLAVAVAAKEHLQSITMAIGSASGLAVSLAGWLAAQASRAGKLLGQAEKLEKAAKKARVEKEKSPQLQRLRETTIRLAKQKEVASEKLSQARAKVRKLEEELREMRPERRLLRFIEERAGAKDYRQHLGLVSLVRRDFRELSRLFTEKKDGRTKWEKLLGGPEKSIDRIVLYVDDLDRCQPQRVVEVLEAVHLLLDFPLFVAVVAVDPRWVKQSLRAHYSKLLSGAIETNNNANSPLAHAESTHNTEDQATPLDYLEKIFHIPFHLPQMTQDGFTKLISKLARQTEDGIPAVRTTERHSDASPPSEESDAMRQETNLQDQKIHPALRLRVSITDTSSEKNAVASGDHTLQAGSKALGVVQLEDWEVSHLNEYATLVRTPRAAKRFLNTYRLVRAGLAAEDWSSFRGDTKASGESRVAMLLLAAAAGSPALARDWFTIFRNADPTAVFFSDEDPRSKQAEWGEFKRIYDATFTETTFNITPVLFVKWLERVERFTF